MNCEITGLKLDFEEIDRNFSRCRGLPIHTCADPKIFEFEMENIFEETWQFLRPVTRVAKLGKVKESQSEVA